MTYLPAKVMSRWFHLHLHLHLIGILDLDSRKIVGAEVHDSDDSVHAVHLMRRTALAEDIAAMDTKPVPHVDNGSTLKAITVLAMFNWLGIKPSYSRPRVIDDNAFAESLFRAAKYRPELPAQGTETLDGARAWTAEFVCWCNVEHRGSGIRKRIPLELVFALIETPDSGPMIGARELTSGSAWDDCLPRTHAQRLYATAAMPETVAVAALLTKIKGCKLIDRDGVLMDSFTPGWWLKRDGQD